MPLMTRPSSYCRVGKRLLDLCLAFPLSLCSVPLLLLLSTIIYRELGSPVIFRQVRAGFKGQPFTLYKFRTLHDTYGEDSRILPDEKRISRLGAVLRSLSLDELPQFWNVLKGDLSLVGPRPLLMEYLPLYTKEENARHNTKPGITGWAQVNGRNAITWEDKFKLDVWYVDNQSLKVDLKIIFLTIHKVFTRDGINQAGRATIEKFTRDVC